MLPISNVFLRAVSGGLDRIPFPILWRSRQAIATSLFSYQDCYTWAHLALTLTVLNVEKVWLNFILYHLCNFPVFVSMLSLQPLQLKKIF